MRAPTIQVDDWSASRMEFEVLCEQHSAETGSDQDAIPLAPDWDLYAQMEKSGALLFITVRNPHLVGYMTVIVWGHLHYKTTLYATDDIFWLAPQYRKGWTGYRLLKFALDELTRRKVKKVQFSHQIDFAGARVGKLFERLGLIAAEIAYTKLL